MSEDTISKAPRSSKRANELDGSEWTRFSISVWKDIHKTPEESKYHHPAMFPTMLTTRLIRCFAAPSDKIVLDPFMGSGSTLVSALSMGNQDNPGLHASLGSTKCRPQGFHR